MLQPPPACSSQVRYARVAAKQVWRGASRRLTLFNKAVHQELQQQVPQQKSGTRMAPPPKSTTVSSTPRRPGFVLVSGEHTEPFPALSEGILEGPLRKQTMGHALCS